MNFMGITPLMSTKQGFNSKRRHTESLDLLLLLSGSLSGALASNATPNKHNTQ